jgi:hypothetical protein
MSGPPPPSASSTRPSCRRLAQSALLHQATVSEDPEAITLMPENAESMSVQSMFRAVVVKELAIEQAEMCDVVIYFNFNLCPQGASAFKRSTKLMLLRNETYFFMFNRFNVTFDAACLPQLSHARCRARPGRSHHTIFQGRGLSHLRTPGREPRSGAKWQDGAGHVGGGFFFFCERRAADALHLRVRCERGRVLYLRARTTRPHRASRTATRTLRRPWRWSSTRSASSVRRRSRTSCRRAYRTRPRRCTRPASSSGSSWATRCRRRSRSVRVADCIERRWAGDRWPAFSCNLLKSDMEIMILSADSLDNARTQIEGGLNKMALLLGPPLFRARLRPLPVRQGVRGRDRW